MLPSGATVLVVEDDDDLRHEVVERMSEQFGRVLEAPSAEIALYECGAHAVDVVATSARLPGMGADALRSELVRHEGPPIVAYRLDGGAGERGRWLEAGGADCMGGSDPALVAARCRAALRRRGAARVGSGSGRGGIRRRRVTPGALRWR